MSTPSIMTDRRREILLALTHKIRLITPTQVARTWWTATASGLSSARRELSALKAAGFLRQSRVIAHPEIELAEPVATWTPGDPEPNPDRIAYRLQSRWTEPSRSAVVFFASRQAANHFGGAGGTLHRLHQVGHDLHLAAVYLRLHQVDPTTAAAWISEDRLPRPERPGEKLPDAVLKDPAGRIYRVIEFGGAYDARRVSKFHTFCAAHGYPYELW
jgi:hypothetical protein